MPSVAWIYAAMLAWFCSAVDTRDAVWLEHQRDAFMEVAGPHLRRAMATLRFTVQRTRDTLRLRRSAIYEHGG